VKRVAVVDTHVLVAGLITRSSESPVAQILDGMVVAAFPYALSEALLAEYRTVLVRPELLFQHGLSEAEVDALLTDLVQLAIVVDPVRGPTAPDPGDQLLWDLLGARPELVLVTGGKRLLADAGMKERVLSAREFLSTAPA
jgi:uncharacterized protein